VVDGVDPRVSRIVISYTESAVATWLSQRQIDSRPNFVSIKPRILFNSEIESRHFMVPGLIALLMTVIGPLLTALLFVRERERGSMEAMLATPVRSVEFILAKVGWYLVLGVGTVMLMVGLAVCVMDIPLRGSVWPIALATSLFMLCVLGLGAAISLVATTQAAATRLVLTTGYLPAYMLSGLTFDLRSAPEPIQWISQIVPARHLASILHTVMLAGDVWSAILPDYLALALIALVLLGGSTILLRRRAA
jgi:ABC-2 type transport system permease protein